MDTKPKSAKQCSNLGRIFPKMADDAHNSFGIPKTNWHTQLTIQGFQLVSQRRT